MKACWHRLLLVGGCGFFVTVLVADSVGAASNEARVTQIVREVKLLPSEAKPKPAAINDKVSEGTGVRTGDKSRSELTFVDMTIERLGANTFFSFNKAGRSVELGGGSMLLRVPKDSGGARMTTSAVTVGITGTTVILEAQGSGRNRLMVLEGGARLSLNKYPKESVVVRAGQMEDVPPGTTKLSPPTNIDIDDVMKKNPLITDFPALPSRDLIYAAKSQPTGPGPVAGRPPIIPDILTGISGGGINVGGINVGGRGRERTRPETTRGGKGQQTAPRTPNADVASGSDSFTGAKPTATPSRRKKPKGK